MKKISLFILLVFLILASIMGYRYFRASYVSIVAEESIWTEDFATALVRSAESSLPILLYFTGSDWCKWCIRLEEEVFTQPTFIKYATDNFILFMADFPTSNKQSAEIIAQNERLLRLYEIKGFPTIIVLSTTGEVIAETGYLAGGAENWVIQLINQMRKE